MTAAVADNTAKVLANDPSALPDVKDHDGNLRVQSDIYEASGLTAGSTIAIAYLPNGAKVKEIIVDHDALGGSSTLACGDVDTAARYFAASSTSSAGTLRLSAIGGRNFQVVTEDASGDDTRRILLTTAGATINGTIKTTVVYAVDG